MLFDAPRTLPDVAALPALPRPARVLMVSPEHFRVEYVINPHMEGNVGTVDPEEARRQWDALRTAYERLGLRVSVLPGVEDLPDMVFCANQTLPFRTPGGLRGVVPSRMRAVQRKPEVEHVTRFFEAEGYEVHPLGPDVRGDFEGMGDALWHPGRFLLWGGYGYRTDPGVYAYLAEHLGIPTVPLRLTDPDFYHLDTCLCPLDESTALYVPAAFDEEGLEAITSVFARTIEAPEDEARHRFACNAHCPDGRHVLIQRGCEETVRRLREAGYVPVELETGEFLKSGGSVFCMKMMFW